MKEKLAKFIKTIPRRLLGLLMLILVCVLAYMDKDITAAFIAVPVALYVILSNNFEADVLQSFE